MFDNLLKIDISNSKDETKDEIIKIKFQNDDVVEINFLKFYLQSKYIRDKYKYCEALDSLQDEIDETTEKFNIGYETMKNFIEVIEEEKVNIPIELYKDFYTLSLYFRIPKLTSVLDNIRQKYLCKDLNFSLQVLLYSETATDNLETKLTNQIENFLISRINECIKNSKFGKLTVSTIFRLLDQSKEKVDQNLLTEFIFESVNTRFILFKFVQIHELTDENIEYFIKFIEEQEDDLKKMYLEYIPFDFSFIKNIKIKYNQLFIKLNHTKQKLNQTKQELNQTKQEFDQTKQELNQTKQEFDQTKQEFDQTKQEFDQTKQELTQTKQELNQTKQEFDQTKQELTQTKQELNQTKQEFDQTKQEFDQTKQEFDQTKQEFDQTKQEFDQTKQELNQTKQELTQTKQELNQTKQELTQTKQEFDQTKQELNQTKQDLKHTKQEFDHTKQEFDQTKQELNQTKQELNQTKQELNQTKQELNQTNQKLNQTNQELNRTRQDLKQTKQEFDHTKQEFDHTKQEFDHTKQEFDQTKQELSKTNQELNQTKQELNQTKQELNQTKQELNQTKQDLNQTNQKLNQTNQELNHTKQEFNRIKQELNQTNQELNRTKLELNKTKQETKIKFEQKNGKFCNIKEELRKCESEMKQTKNKCTQSIIVGGDDSFNLLGEKPNNVDEDGNPIISPPVKLSFNPSSLLSYSAFSEHSVLVMNDGSLKGIGNNRDGKISATLQKTVINDFTDFSIKDGSGRQLAAVSAVCNAWGTLYMFSKSNCNERQLVLCDWQINSGDPVFLDIGNHHPVSLFGGHSHSAAIGSEGEVIFINRKSVKNSPNSPIMAVSLPDNEKASSVACCDDSVVVLSTNGRVFTSPVDSNRVLNFSIVSELSGHEIVCVSGTSNHFLAVSKEGRVFGCGSNKCGELCLNKETESVSSFTEISSLFGYEIRAAYAGFNHSLFETRGGKIFSCGSNDFGELLLSRGPGKDVYSPTETTITSGAAFCIAGWSTSTVFIGSNPPPNIPNKRIQEYKS